jgi:hypothetical protein
MGRFCAPWEVRDVGLVLSSEIAGCTFGFLLVWLAYPAAWGETRLAISGYDPVAYFTDGKPVPGLTEFEHLWHDARWRFASAAHRDLFVGDPNRYAPQYDGYCAGGVSSDAPHKDTVDPEAWAIVDGKLYLTHTTRSLGRWSQNQAEKIKTADQNWPTIKTLPEPTKIGQPCRDGRRWRDRERGRQAVRRARYAGRRHPPPAAPGRAAAARL